MDELLPMTKTGLTREVGESEQEIRAGVSFRWHTVTGAVGSVTKALSCGPKRR
jgi:hypothetical protein